MAKNEGLFARGLTQGVKVWRCLADGVSRAFWATDFLGWKGYIVALAPNATIGSRIYTFGALLRRPHSREKETPRVEYHNIFMSQGAEESAWTGDSMVSWLHIDLMKVAGKLDRQG